MEEKKKSRNDYVTVISAECAPFLTDWPLFTSVATCVWRPNQIAGMATESRGLITWQPVYTWGATRILSPCPWRIDWLNVSRKDLTHWFFFSFLAQFSHQALYWICSFSFLLKRIHSSGHFWIMELPSTRELIRLLSHLWMTQLPTFSNILEYVLKLQQHKSPSPTFVFLSVVWERI